MSEAEKYDPLAQHRLEVDEITRARVMAPPHVKGEQEKNEVNELGEIHQQLANELLRFRELTKGKTAKGETTIEGLSFSGNEETITKRIELHPGTGKIGYEVTLEQIDDGATMLDFDLHMKDLPGGDVAGKVLPENEQVRSSKFDLAQRGGKVTAWHDEKGAWQTTFYEGYLSLYSQNENGEHNLVFSMPKGCPKGDERTMLEILKRVNKSLENLPKV